MTPEIPPVRCSMAKMRDPVPGSVPLSSRNFRLLTMCSHRKQVMHSFEGARRSCRAGLFTTGACAQQRLTCGSRYRPPGPFLAGCASRPQADLPLSQHLRLHMVGHMEQQGVGKHTVVALCRQFEVQKTLLQHLAAAVGTRQRRRAGCAFQVVGGVAQPCA